MKAPFYAITLLFMNAWMGSKNSSPGAVVFLLLIRPLKTTPVPW